jgi:hypothetical protein
MARVVILTPVVLAGSCRAAGDVVDAPESEARYAISRGHARLADASDIADARNPRSAAETRADLDMSIATAVPGGKRPGRK